RDLRKWLYLKNQDLVFLGSQKDVNGFAHEASVYATSREILTHLDKIPAAENYVLFFGAQDKETDKTQLKESICKIISGLSNREQTKKLIVIALPPSHIEGFDAYNTAYNETLKECVNANNKSVLIPL